MALTKTANTLLMIMVLYAAVFLPAPVMAGPAGEDKAERLKVFEQRIRSIEGNLKIPIIDVEHHWGRKHTLPQLIEKMDRNGVALTWLGPNEGMGDKYSLEANNAFPAYFVPTIIHGDGPRWHGKDKTLLAEIAADARSGRYFAMGEFEARHYVSSTNNRDVHLPLTSESFRVIFQLSQETGMPFLIHHEAEDVLLPELESMLQEFPGAKVVWCHVGRNRNPVTWSQFKTPDGVRRLLAQYPNLYFDIVQSSPGSKYGPTGYLDAVMYDLSGGKAGLGSRWRQLFIDYADRFVIGSDVNGGRWDNYDSVFQTFRGIVLPALPRDVAEKIAFKNAWWLMSGQPWQD